MIHVTHDIKQRITQRQSGEVLPGLSRSLTQARWVDFPQGRDDKDWRRRTATALQNAATEPRKLASWRSFALSLAGAEKEKSPRLLFARQMGRLLVGMAGGVFENGGLTLDRTSGIPYIPGSAVKGCARRCILAALHEWNTGQLTPGDPTNPLASLVLGFNSPAELLLALIRIFGWSDEDWKDTSDLAWACGETWSATRKEVTGELLDTLGIKPRDVDKPWLDLPLSAGSISFLPAYPWEKDPGIDLDVLTCHHGDYYSEKKDAEDNLIMPEALDTEEPVPVIFPAVRPAQTWCFLLNPMHCAAESDLAHTRRWLAHGLEIFGLGGKTNAGYGWFDTSDAVQQAVRNKLAAEQERQTRDAEALIAKQQADREAKLKADAKAALAAALEGLTSEQQEDKKLELLSDPQFEAKVKAFCKEPKRGGPTDPEKQAIVRALRGPRLTYWQTFKAKATKGDLATVEQAIRQLSKTLNLGKMP